MQKILNKIIVVIFFLSSGCAASWEEVKKGLGGAKRTSTDEFLVKKKEPLTMPPKWKELPEPGQSSESDSQKDEATDIEDLIQLGKKEETLINIEEQSGNLEDSILKQIKQK